MTIELTHDGSSGLFCTNLGCTRATENFWETGYINHNNGEFETTDYGLCLTCAVKEIEYQRMTEQPGTRYAIRKQSEGDPTP